jgi:sugar transferase (PEP-CTERM/EpsH1 system associated)
MTRRIAKAVQSQAYDLAFVFGSTMAQYVEPWPDLPKILDLVDVDSDKWVQYSAHSRRPLSWLWNREGRNLAKLESIFVESFSNTLVCTEAEARLLRAKAQAGQISVLQNSLDLDYFRPESVSVPGKIRSLQPYVIFTGTMNYFPNVDAVQYFCKQVLPHTRSKASGLRFVIAGRNPSAAVRRLAADSAIEITGAVPDIRPYLQGALLAVAPMRIARGVQNKILEALAMDIPVVASSIAAAALPPELAPLVEAEVEAEQFAARIADYVLSPPRRNGSRRTSVSRYVETLDLPSQLEQLMQNAVADKTVEESEAGIAV